MPEREVKLEAPPRFTLPDLQEVSDLKPGEATTLRLRTTYWDTPDLRLARWGVSLRRRTGEPGGAVWTVKLPGSSQGRMLVRPEHEFRGGSGQPPAGALDLLRAYVRAAELAPVATLEARRRLLPLLGEDGATRLEVSDDVVSVLEGKRVALRFREIEVEAREGATSDSVDAVVDRLRAAGAGDPQAGSKQARALGPRASAPAEVSLGDIAPGHPAGDVARRAIAASTIRLLRHDAGVRLGGDIEDVHQARVATRRLRSDLRTFRHLLDEEWTNTTRAELGWIAGLLGAVRDADVLLERLDGALAETGQSTAGKTLRRKLVAEQTSARASLLEAIRTDRYVDLLERLVTAAREPPLTESAEEPAVALAEVAARPWNRLKKARRELDHEPSDADLHALRLRAKRARYAAEAVAPVFGRQAEAFAGAVAGLQGVLGDLHDAAVMRDWLEAHVRGLGQRAAFAAGAVAELERQHLVADRVRWRDAWAKIGKGRQTEWMKSA